MAPFAALLREPHVAQALANHVLMPTAVEPALRVVPLSA